jgi:hypothetical protein
MIEKETSITMRKPKSLVMNFQAMTLSSMAIIPPSVWAMPNMELPGIEAARVKPIASSAI